MFYFIFYFLSPQREEEAAGERGESHPVQLERQEVHHRRRVQDQPIAARLHQEPGRLHPERSWKLKLAQK